MSKSYSKDITTSQANIITDLSACFKYPFTDDTSVISDIVENKKRSQEKKICRIKPSNLEESFLAISHKTNESHETGISVKFKPDGANGNNSNTFLNFVSISDSRSENREPVVPKMIKKINFFGLENMSIGKSLHVYKKEFVESQVKNKNNQSTFAIKRINFSLHGRFFFEKNTLKFQDKELNRNLKLFRKGIYKYKVKRLKSGNNDSSIGASTQLKPERCCNCKSSKCLKLYCECFKAKGYCLDSCKCIDCGNRAVPSDESKDNLLLKIINSPNDHKIQKLTKILNSKNHQINTDFSTGLQLGDVHMSSPNLYPNFHSERIELSEVNLTKPKVIRHCNCFSKDCGCGKISTTTLEYSLNDFENQS